MENYSTSWTLEFNINDLSESKDLPCYKIESKGLIKDECILNAVLTAVQE